MRNICILSHGKPKRGEVYGQRLGDAEVVKQDPSFWQAVQAVIARGAGHWGNGLVGRALLRLSRDLNQIKLLAPESYLPCPERVAYQVIDNFFFFDDWRNTKVFEHFN